MLLRCEAPGQTVLALAGVRERLYHAVVSAWLCEQGIIMHAIYPFSLSCVRIVYALDTTVLVCE